MSQRNILITGAGSGIGLGMAETMAAQGHFIWCSDISQERAETAVNAIHAQGGQAAPLVLDVSQQLSIEPLAKNTADQPVDVLINNAGLQFVSRLEDFPPDRFAYLIQVMLTGPAMLARAVLPGMRQRGFGRIINIGSIHSLVGSPYKSAYVAAKHGLIGFSKVLALETGDTDITVNTLCPSYVKTPLVEQQIKAQAKEHGIAEEEVIRDIMLEPMPKKQFVSLRQLSDIALFLMSDSARNITGQPITVDGGWTVR